MKNRVSCIPLTHSACLHMMFYMVLDLFSNNTHTLWEFYQYLTFDSVSDSEYFYNKYFRKPKVKCVSNCFSVCFLSCLAFLWDVLRLSRAGTCRLCVLCGGRCIRNGSAHVQVRVSLSQGWCCALFGQGADLCDLFFDDSALWQIDFRRPQTNEWLSFMSEFHEVWCPDVIGLGFGEWGNPSEMFLKKSPTAVGSSPMQTITHLDE